MTIPVEDDVRTILSDFEFRLRAVIDRAWSEWMESDIRGRLIRNSAKATVVFDFIVRHALAEFDGDPDIHVIPKHSTVKFLFKDTVLLRFKKGNAKGVGSNIETQAVLDFIDPERKLFPGLPDILKIEVCYQPDRLGTQIEEVAVVARDRNKRIWAYPLEIRAGAEIIPLPTRKPDTSAPPEVVIRKPADEVESGE
jgi:hypothetical protein